jgi:hypothetical protein
MPQGEPYSVRTYETARSRLGVAKATAPLGDRTGAARDARAALAVFEQLGARLEIEGRRGS